MLGTESYPPPPPPVLFQEIPEKDKKQGWEIALCFFMQIDCFLERKSNSLFSKSDSLSSLFLKEHRSECRLLQRAGIAMKSDLLFCFVHKRGKHGEKNKFEANRS